MKQFLKLAMICVLITGTVGLVTTSCTTGGGAAGSKVTVTLSNAGAVNDQYLFAYLYAENETDVNNPVAVLATNYDQIAGDAASFVLKTDDGEWGPTTTDWTGTDGVKYDVYIFTDADGNSEPEAGSDKATDPFPHTVTLNGDQTLEVDYTTMVPYPADGTVTVSLTNGMIDHYLFVYAYGEGETDITNADRVLATNNIIIPDGTAEVVLKVDDGDFRPTRTDWTGTGGMTYDIYIYTDSDSDGEPTTGLGTAKQAETFPQTLTINGNKAITVDYTEDMINYVF